MTDPYDLIPASFGGLNDFRVPALSYPTKCAGIGKQASGKHQPGETN
jgi:hypothetical protein